MNDIFRGKIQLGFLQLFDFELIDLKFYGWVDNLTNLCDLGHIAHKSLGTLRRPLVAKPTHNSISNRIFRLRDFINYFKQRSSFCANFDILFK
jgi:hypothetical protein